MMIEVEEFDYSRVVMVSTPPQKEHGLYRKFNTETPDRRKQDMSFLTGVNRQILLSISQGKRQEAMDCVKLITNFIEENINEDN